MLSKLEHFGASYDSPERPAERQALQKALARHFRSAVGSADVTPAEGGTLGVCFHVSAAGARRFLKTHLPHARARANLSKEGEILVQLYGSTVVLDRIEVRPEQGTTRLCLVMAELVHLPLPMDAEGAAAMIRELTRRLAGYRPAGLNAAWDFEHYLAHGRRAVGELAAHGLIGSRTTTGLEDQLNLLGSALGTLPRALCHGDFGPKNIMTDGQRPIALDWEDAFWGVAGFDYLYWLTFMDNRRFLGSSAFGRTELDATVERAILALVVLLKSLLSVRSGAHVSNTVPIEVRIAEVLALPLPAG